MEILVLSCSTGGGHNTAAQAIAEELSARGHKVTTLDPYQLAGEHLATVVGNTYIGLVQKNPFLFGIVYAIGNAYRRIPGRSPVYWANRRMVKYLRRYLQKNRFDLAVMTHLFPAEIFTHMKNESIPVPKTILVATDYTCIPFTEETRCDYYVIPSPKLAEEFRQRGIPQNKIVPLGIPVRRQFQTRITKAEAKKRLQLDPEKHYILLSGGSIGAGKIRTVIKVLKKYLRRNRNTVLIVLCGNNQKLQKRLLAAHGTDPQIQILSSTSRIALYMKASDLFLSKPGGLSSTEGAAANIPMIHIPPIPGCETKNAAFFAKYGLSLSVRNIRKQLLPAVEYLQKPENIKRMKERQEQYISGKAAERICRFIETDDASTSPASLLP